MDVLALFLVLIIVLPLAAWFLYEMGKDDNDSGFPGS